MCRINVDLIKWRRAKLFCDLLKVFIQKCTIFQHFYYIKIEVKEHRSSKCACKGPCWSARLSVEILVFLINFVNFIQKKIWISYSFKIFCKLFDERHFHNNGIKNEWYLAGTWKTLIWSLRYFCFWACCRRVRNKLIQLLSAIEKCWVNCGSFHSYNLWDDHVAIECSLYEHMQSSFIWLWFLIIFFTVITISGLI